MGGRVIAIGLDAAEWTYLDPLLDTGQLPRLAALRASSARATLRNNPVYRAEIPWSQFLSGRAAETTGYWGPVRYDPATYEVHQGLAPSSQPPFYAFGDDAKVIAFDVPQSVIADGVDGVQVTGWGAHAAQYPRTSVPAGLLEEIDERFGCHPAFDQDFELYWHREDFVDGLADALVRGTRTRGEIVTWLAEEHDWDLLVTVLSEPHSAGHAFWHATDPQHPHRALAATRRAGERLLDVHLAVDAAVGRILDALPDDVTVVVFSVHGMRSNESDIPVLALLPELLHRLEGRRPLLHVRGERRWRAAGLPPVTPDPTRGQEAHLADAFAVDDLPGRLRRLFRQRLPRPVVAWKRRAQVRRQGWSDRVDAPIEREVDPAEVASRRLSLGWQPPTWYAPYWPRSRVFAMPSYSDGHIRINVAGREGRGQVDPSDFQAECDRVRAELFACRDPRTGRAIVLDIVQTRTSPEPDDGPLADLIVLWAPYVDSLEHPRVGLIGPFPHLRTGEHTPNGFLFAAGPGIAPRELGEASALDVPPTICALLGRPVEDLDGAPLPVREPSIPAAGT